MCSLPQVGIVFKKIPYFLNNLSIVIKCNFNFNVVFITETFSRPVLNTQAKNLYFIQKYKNSIKTL